MIIFLWSSWESLFINRLWISLKGLLCQSITSSLRLLMDSSNETHLIMTTSLCLQSNHSSLKTKSLKWLTCMDLKTQMKRVITRVSVSFAIPPLKTQWFFRADITVFALNALKSSGCRTASALSVDSRLRSS